jgi:LysR family transcriptional regulator, low CO2-responsive transcriptional regulator
VHSSDLRAFVAFADALNFTHAARAVHLSQPALFACVKRLGEQVGAPLYERRGRALALTVAGEQLALHGRDVLEGERALLASVRGDDDAATSCTLAIGEGALTHVVSEHVAAFARAHPRVLRVSIADGPAALALVSKGSAHVAVVAGNVRDDHDALVSRAIVKSHVVAIGARALLQPREALSLVELATLPLVLPPRGRPLRDQVDAALALHGLTPRVVVEASGWGALVALARLACGVALVNDVVALPRGVVARPVEGLAPVVYRAVRRRRSTALGLELFRILAP